MDISTETFGQEVLKSDLPVLVDFWAEWCGPCRMFAPIIDEVATASQGKLKVCKVNVDDCSDLASQYGIMSIPTVILFKNGEVAEKIVGSRPKAELMAVIAPHLS